MDVLSIYLMRDKTCLMETPMPLILPTADQIAAARRFVGNPGLFGHLDRAVWDDLHTTSWTVLRAIRPTIIPLHCTVRVIPRAIFEAHAHPAPHLRHRSHTPGDAA